MPRGRIIALSHGGGPMPILGDPSSASIAASLRTRVPEILRLNSPDPKLRPRAIILVTAHWTSPTPATFPGITSSASPSLIYDYYGFPPESYTLKYPAPGAPKLAEKLAAFARTEGLTPSLEDRGWDHGVFVPLLLALPGADIPILQVSVSGTDDAACHFALGRALAKLRESEEGAGGSGDEVKDGGVAIVGSGFASFHNLRVMLGGAGVDLSSPEFAAGRRAWNDAVTDAAATRSSAEREAKFARWRSWPGAYVSHPPRGSEHFMPLAVCAGAAGEAEAKFFVDEFNGLEIYSYYWE